jgi:ribosomal protein L21E
MNKFKTGDLVKIRDGTHQAGMPDHRVGLIVEHGEASGNYTEAYTVVFLGTDFRLKFHAMFLEHFTPS